MKKKLEMLQTKVEKVDGQSTKFSTERQLPYTATAILPGRSWIFDGAESNFGAWKWRIEHHLAKLKLSGTLVRIPLEEEYAVPKPGATQEQEEARRKKYRKRLDERLTHWTR